MSDSMTQQEPLSGSKLLLIGFGGCWLWFTAVMHTSGFGYQLPLIGLEFGSSPGQTQWVHACKI